MKVTNNAARLVFIQAPSGLLRLVPMLETTIDAADEAAVQAALDGPLKALVEQAQLVLVPTDPPPPPPDGGATGAGTGIGSESAPHGGRKR